MDMCLVRHVASCLTIEQVMGALQLSRQKVYDLINRSGLPVIHFGAAVRVRSVALSAWLEGRGRGEGSIYQRKDGRWASAISIVNRKRRTFYGKTRKEVADKMATAIHEQ